MEKKTERMLVTDTEVTIPCEEIERILMRYVDVRGSVTVFWGDGNDMSPESATLKIHHQEPLYDGDKWVNIRGCDRASVNGVKLTPEQVKALLAAIDRLDSEVRAAKNTETRKGGRSR